MAIVVFCILKLIFISIASSQSVAPSHVCEYMETSGLPLSDAPFSVSDVPDRCELITLGVYYLDSGKSNDGSPMIKKDADAIKSLTAAGKRVYTYVGYTSSDNATWNDILDPQDQALYDKLVFPLIEKIKEIQLTGIILNIINLYYGTPDLANKISVFVTKLKEQVPDLEFGLAVVPFSNEAYTKIPNKDLFDYTITNSVIDLYFIDSHTHEFECTRELSQSGTLISRSDKNVKSLEFLNNIISQSTIEKKKTIACIVIFPLSPNSLRVFTPYSKYCNTPGAADTGEWCLDDSQRLYDIGAYIKNFFAGISVCWIQYDDVQGSCQCQQSYPVTNTVFDGWDGTPITPCAKLNKTI